jgi:hypothetical protein
MLENDPITILVHDFLLGNTQMIINIFSFCSQYNLLIKYTGKYTFCYQIHFDNLLNNWNLLKFTVLNVLIIKTKVLLPQA